jgi:hypothetical protein
MNTTDGLEFTQTGRCNPILVDPRPILSRAFIHRLNVPAGNVQ